MAKKSKTLTPEDCQQFREAVRGTIKIHDTKMPPIPTPVKKKKTTQDDPSQREPPILFSDYEIEAAVTAESHLFYAKSGLSNKMLRKLKRGEYNIDAILDLHGKTIDEAREALSDFLLHCRSHSLQCVIVIHGKGRGKELPVLKNKINHWLRQTEHVIAFCSTAPANLGSVTVLLKK